MFVVSEGRGIENKGLSDWVKLGHESINSNSSETGNQEIESEEFVFL
jgi:hypothetical protein